MQCPSEAELAACLIGKVAVGRAEALLEHATTCESCSKVIEKLEHSVVDDVSEALRSEQRRLELSESCTRMMDRAEDYIHGGQLTNPVEQPTNTQHLLQGTRIRDYEIVRPIGEGGMGTVFLAKHVRLNRDVAVKVLSLRRSGNREAQQRFEQEMAIVGKLQHPGIVRALDAGEQDGVQYLVMELLNGADLRQIVDVLGPVPVSDACEICRQAALALHYAHTQQLVHRDVKPSNIMLLESGTIKVMDLGLAKLTDETRSLTSTHQAMGSLDFMAPEQLRADAIDHRADTYGLGCTLYYLLLGEPPEKRRTAALMVARSIKLESVRELLPPPLTRLLQSMLTADPNRRLGSMADVAEQLAPFCNRADLRQLAANAAGTQPDRISQAPTSITSTIEKEVKPRTSAAWFATAVLACCVLAGISLFSVATSSDAIELSSLPSENSNIDATREIPLFQLHSAAVQAVDYCAVTRQLICGSDDKTITVRYLPNQHEIIRIVGASDAIIDICVFSDSNRFAALDASGHITALDLPDADVVWRLDSSEFSATPKSLLALSHERLLVELSDGRNAVLKADDGGRATDVDVSQFPPSSENDFTERWLINGSPPTMATNQTALGEQCLASENRAHLVNLKQRDAKYFIYAEHTQPICSVFAFPNGSLFFTGDESGEVRIWQAPHLPRSDMLLSCSTRIDSADLTYEIHRQNKWAESSFEPSSPLSSSDPNTSTFTANINGQQHLLELKRLLQ